MLRHQNKKLFIGSAVYIITTKVVQNICVDMMSSSGTTALNDKQIEIGSKIMIFVFRFEIIFLVKLFFFVEYILRNEPLQTVSC